MSALIPDRSLITRKRLRTALLGLLILLALVLGRIIDEGIPRTFEPLRPFERHAALDEVVSLRWGEVRVTSVTAAPQIEGIIGVSTTPELWLVVELEATPRWDASTVQWVQIRDGADRIFTRGRGQLGCTRTNPGVTTGCVVSFEVSAEHLAGARLTVGHAVSDERADDVAVIDLQIAQDQVDRWLDVDEPLVLPTPRSVGAGSAQPGDRPDDGTDNGPAKGPDDDAAGLP
ncbi:MAG: hypothetical protein Q4G67_01010 [Actinomycetia bacterium]|nr:hypothetical protein [Actinomycetes bacterium]